MLINADIYACSHLHIMRSLCYGAQETQQSSNILREECSYMCIPAQQAVLISSKTDRQTELLHTD
jgi:hypothetical protein